MVRERQRYGGQGAEHLDASGIEARLLLRLAQCGGDGVHVARVDAPAGERDLAGVGAQGRGPGEEQDVEVARDPGCRRGSVARDAIEDAEEHQDGRPSRGRRPAGFADRPGVAPAVRSDRGECCPC
ncbi:hypothetical protein ASF75_08080 [Curtobacterium sp. Leaf154]|nr:hypothetical protein ASF75_08080 [Curtobacterium sp. Leaf154]